MTSKKSGWEALTGPTTDVTRARSARGPNPETALVAAIMEAIRTHGLWVERIPVQGVRHQTGGQVIMKRSPLAGFPDLLVIGPEGTTAWLEVKTPKGRASPLQLERLTRLSALGHVAAIVRSVDEALTVLKENAFVYCPVVDAQFRERLRAVQVNPEAFDV